MATPAGLRSQTPINQTASKPNAAMASHSVEGSEDKSRFFPYFCLSSESQTQVSISYNVGYLGQTYTVAGAPAGSASVALILMSSHGKDPLNEGSQSVPRARRSLVYRTKIPSIVFIRD